MKSFTLAATGFASFYLAASTGMFGFSVIGCAITVLTLDTVEYEYGWRLPMNHFGVAARGTLQRMKVFLSVLLVLSVFLLLSDLVSRFCAFIVEVSS